MTKAKPSAPTTAPRMAPLPTLLSVSAVAIELSVSTKTVRRLIERGALPCCRVGRLVRIRAMDLAEFVASRTAVLGGVWDAD
jgi:excisionase family DNA binding protein